MSMKKIIFPVIALAVVGTAGYFVYNWLTDGRYHETTDNAYLESDLVALSPKVSGYVSTLQVAENQTVKKGDLLLTIGDETFAAQLDKANAALEASRSAVLTVDAQIALQQAAIDQSLAQIRVAQVELNRAHDDFSRYKDLVKKGAASRQSYDHAAADQDKARAQLTAAKATLAVEKGRLSVLRAQKIEAQSAVSQAVAEVDLAQQALDDTVLRAPFDGVIGNRSVQVGALVQPGQQLLILVPLPNVYVVANFKETQISGLAPGQQVSVEIDAFPDQKFVGEVDSFSPATGAEFSLLPPENATGNFTKITQRVPVRIKLTPNKMTASLRPGLSVVVDVDVRDMPGLAARSTDAAHVAAKIQ